MIGFRSLRNICALLALLAPAAQAAQLSEDFGNAAYNGSFNTTLWDGGATSPSLVQGGGKLAVAIPQSNWAAAALATRAQAAIMSGNLKKGTSFQVVVDSAPISADGDQVRGGLPVDTYLQCMFYDNQGYNDGMYGWNGAALAVLVYFTNDTDKVALEVFQKNPGNPFWIGEPIAFRTVAVTFPLQVEMVMNQKFYELHLNGSKVLGGVTNVAPGLFGGQCGFEVLSANAGTGRGSINYDAIAIGDAAGTDFSAQPEWLSEDFSTPTLDPTKLMRMGDSAGTVSLQGGALRMAPGDSNWGSIGVQPAHGFAMDASGLTTLTQEVTLTDVSPVTGSLNLNLAVKEYPGMANQAECKPYFFQDDAALALVFNSEAGATNAHLVMFSKPKANGNANGDVALADTAVTVTLPTTLRLDVSANAYAVMLNGARVAAGTHTAVFNGRIAGGLWAANQNETRGALTVDDYKVGRFGLIGVVNAVRGWSLFE